MGQSAKVTHSLNSLFLLNWMTSGTEVKCVDTSPLVEALKFLLTSGGSLLNWLTMYTLIAIDYFMYKMSPKLGHFNIGLSFLLCSISQWVTITIKPCNIVETYHIIFAKYDIKLWDRPMAQRVKCHCMTYSSKMTIYTTAPSAGCGELVPWFFPLTVEPPFVPADVDECALPFAPCLHHCTNTDGSYFCHCREGFNQNEGFACLATGNKMI